MAICERCGNEFIVSAVRRRINRKHGAGVYDDCYEGEVCFECADYELSSGKATYASGLLSLSIECLLTSFEIVLGSLFKSLAILLNDSPSFNPCSILILPDKSICF